MNLRIYITVMLVIQAGYHINCTVNLRGVEPQLLPEYSFQESLTYEIGNSTGEQEQALDLGVLELTPLVT